MTLEEEATNGSIFDIIIINSILMIPPISFVIYFNLQNTVKISNGSDKCHIICNIIGHYSLPLSLVHIVISFHRNRVGPNIG